MVEPLLGSNYTTQTSQGQPAHDELTVVSSATVEDSEKLQQLLVAIVGNLMVHNALGLQPRQ